MIYVVNKFIFGKNNYFLMSSNFLCNTSISNPEFNYKLISFILLVIIILSLNHEDKFIISNFTIHVKTPLLVPPH